MPQGMPLFNASDLLDPSVLEDIPLAEPEAGSSAADWATPAAPRSTGAFQAQPMLNAADLFDPEVLADLSQGDAEEASRGGNGRRAAEWVPDEEEEEEPFPAPDAWQRPTRQPTGPIGPIFSLPPLTPPPTPPRPSRPIRSQPLLPDDDLPPAFTAQVSDEPDEMEIPSERGWRIVSPPPPPSRPGRNRPVSRPYPAYQQAPYPSMPDPRTAPPRRRGRPSRHHGLASTLGGWLSLLLVLAIISVAIAYGAFRYYQLEGAQNNAGQASAPLPTVAPKAGFLIYRDTSLGFSLQYPGGWQEQADKDKHDSQYKGDMFRISPNAALEVGSSPQYQDLSPAQIDDYVLTNTLGITNANTVSTSVPTDSTIPIAGLNWTPENATVTLTTGQTLTMTCLAISYNGRGYAIFYFTNQQTYDSFNNQYFEPILLSFRFLT